MDNCNPTTWSYGKVNRSSGGFSLLEIMAVLTIVTMVAIAALGVFNRARTASASISNRLDRNDASMEVLQRIAEDLDRIVKPGYNINVTVANKIVDGFNKSQLVIESKIYDKDGKPVVFEKVIWQAQYDEFEESLVVYRGHFGINLDDKILSVAEAQRDEADQKPFVPVCTGMTLFEFTVPREDKEPLQQWTSKNLPPAITVLMSFTPPTELATGEFVILEEDMEKRTIAIDRTKKLRFVFVKKVFNIEDPNDGLDKAGDPNGIDNAVEPGNTPTTRTKASNR
ncbi:MAG: hypothetical protein FVQ79_08445 [Planctomycetes bacterium]|nr:hypothetical protein [Planctomycetota bacterium]